MAISTNGIKTSYLDATPISGRMSIPRRQENAQAMRDDFDLGEPEIRVVAYEVPFNDWVEVIYV
jgi:hypothetical protein